METLEQLMTQGEQTRQVLENPVFAKACTDIEEEHFEALKTHQPATPQGAKHCE